MLVVAIILFHMQVNDSIVTQKVFADTKSRDKSDQVVAVAPYCGTYAFCMSETAQNVIDVLQVTVIRSLSFAAVQW